jgi:hypothetical protein
MMKSIKKYQWKKHEKPKKEQQKECGSNLIEKNSRRMSFEKKCNFKNDAKQNK